MKNKLKRRVSLLTLTAMLLTLLPLQAFASEPTNVQPTPTTEDTAAENDAAGVIQSSGGTTYETLQAAVDEAADGSPTTLTLSGDVAGGEITGAASGNANALVTIPENKDITIDLAGHSIKASLKTDGTNYARAHVILNRGTLTIKDSSEAHSGRIENTNTSSNACTRTIRNLGTLTINGGTITGTVVLLNGGVCTIDGEHTALSSEVEFASGGWDNSSAAIENRDLYDHDSGASLTINAGNVYSKSRAAIYCDSAFTDATINGGTFEGDTAYGDINGITADSMVKVRGGLWKHDPSAFLDEQTAYVEAEQEVGYYKVTQFAEATSHTVSTDAELTAALAEQSQTTAHAITITGDVHLNASAELMAGSTLTIAEGASLTIDEGAVLTQSGIVTNNGTLTVDGFLTEPLRLTGDGTITGVDLSATDVVVEDAMDLQWLTYLVEHGKVKHVTLANDITLPEGVTFQEIGAGEENFFGTAGEPAVFDGAGHTISGLKVRNNAVDTGLFKFLQDATIKDLTLDVDIESQSAYTGGITGNAISGVTMQNVTVRGRVAVSGASYGCAGLAGSVGGAVFIGCRNEAAVGGADGYNIGSIFGTASGSTEDIKVYNCANSGTITAKGSVGQVYGYGGLSSSATSTIVIIGFDNSDCTDETTKALNLLGAASSGERYITTYANAAQYKAVQQANGSWQAVPAETATADISGVPYATFADAVTAAEAGDTISVTGTMAIDSTVTIDKDITVKGFKKLNVGESGKLTLSAGRYDADPTAYLAEGYKVRTEGSWYIIVPEKAYIITFDANGGCCATTTSETGADGKLTALPTPTRDGYDFDGWFTAASGGDAVNTETVFSADTTLYAQWTRHATGGGTVIPTPDPSVDSEETVTNPDGSTTTTITCADGSSSVTTIDTDGQVTAEVDLSKKAISNAGDDAVSLPMPALKATVESDAAPTVSVSLPGSTTSAKVLVPVDSVTPGTVAVLVDADGSEHVIKDTVQADDGIVVVLADGATIKVVENSRNFDDVADGYWGEDAIDFAVSRGLFAGTAEDLFSPEGTMTRSMLWTVLARYEGANDTPDEGEVWYAAAQRWAVANGISDGNDPSAPMTREQLAAMLYRYVGSPAVSGSVEGFSDADSISSWAEDAMTWAVDQGLIVGMGKDTLQPQGNATRTQVAAIFERFIEARMNGAF